MTHGDFCQCASCRSLRKDSPRKGKHLSSASRKKIGDKKRGIPRSSEIRRTISEATRGKHRTEQTRKRISCATKGSKNPGWRGGKSFEIYPSDFDRSLKQRIQERDGFQCVLCGEDRGLDVHHINYNKRDNDPINLITLCSSCHCKTNFQRDFWKSFFEGFVQCVHLLCITFIRPQ